MIGAIKRLMQQVMSNFPPPNRIKMDGTGFKKCAACDTVWSSRDEFLADPSLILNGYKADFNNLGKGLFFFTHKREDCFSTMTLPAGLFFGIYHGERYTDNMRMQEECPRYCLDEKKLTRCRVACKNAFVREVMQIILERKTPPL